MNVEANLKLIADHAEEKARLAAKAERDTMAVALASFELYQDSGLWVPEWLEQKPAPKRPTAKFREDDQNRFVGWQSWRIQQMGRKPFSRVYSWQLLQSAKVARSVAAATNLASEWPLRPLHWFITNQHEDDLPEVWDMALDLAHGGPITDATTKAAFEQWKKKKYGHTRSGRPRTSDTAISKAANAQGKARKLRARMLDEAKQMYDLACRDEGAAEEFNKMLEELGTYLASVTQKSADAA